MIRIDILYGGKPYSIGGRSLESLQQEVETAITAGLPYWLHVNSGEGRLEDAYLLILPGIPLAFIDVKASGDTSVEDGVINGMAVDPY